GQQGPAQRQGRVGEDRQLKKKGRRYYPASPCSFVSFDFLRILGFLLELPPHDAAGIRDGVQVEVEPCRVGEDLVDLIRGPRLRDREGGGAVHYRREVRGGDTGSDEDPRRHARRAIVDVRVVERAAGREAAHRALEVHLIGVLVNGDHRGSTCHTLGIRDRRHLVRGQQVHRKHGQVARRCRGRVATAATGQGECQNSYRNR